MNRPNRIASVLFGSPDINGPVGLYCLILHLLSAPLEDIYGSLGIAVV